jgi:2-dehydro-3-deoxyphosphogluconate aldolase/(4S)-4-hydroxy-2-oxoglutarate aldolase
MKIEELATAPVIPLIGSNDHNEAVLTTQALAKGGLRFIEVVLRTERALDCLEAIANECDDVIVGAGTVLTVGDVDNVVARGAKYIVSPGLSADVVKRAQHHNVPILPGVMTASEVQNAWGMGLRAVKFFPASLAGGVPMLKAMGSVFGGMRFVPTGGVSANNLFDFLSVPAVIACGGSWLTPKAEIAAGNYAAITNLAKEAMTIASDAKK